MATKKTTTPARRAKPKGTALMSPKDVDDYYRKKAEAQAARLPAGEGNKISIRGGKFTYRGANLGDELTVVIVAFGFENAFYTESFDPDDRRPPACAAVGFDQAALVPMANAPERQAASCAECEHNKWGSAEKGRGKACKNVIRLALIGAAELDADPSAIDVLRLDVPPTSNANFNKFVKGADKVLHRPPEGLITVISFDDDPDLDYPKLLFRTAPEPLLSGEHIALVEQKAAEAETTLLAEYDFTAAAEPRAKKAPGKKGGGKFAPRKPSTARERRR